ASATGGGSTRTRGLRHRLRRAVSGGASAWLRHGACYRFSYSAHRRRGDARRAAGARGLLPPRRALSCLRKRLLQPVSAFRDERKALRYLADSGVLARSAETVWSCSDHWMVRGPAV